MTIGNKNACKTKHKVQNPRRVTKPMSIASTHAQICPRIIMCSATYALIASAELILATKILCELACISREAPRFLGLEPESFRSFFKNSCFTRSFSLPKGRSNLPLYLRSTCLCTPSPQRLPRIAVKGISRHNFRPVHFYLNSTHIKPCIHCEKHSRIVPGCSRCL